MKRLNPYADRSGRGGVLVAMLLLYSSVWAASGSSARPAQEEEDLARKLVRQTTGEAEDDIMTKIMRMMSEGARRLEVTFDAGAQTQALQKEILKQLDDAIAAAARNTRKKPQPDASRSDRRTASRQRPDGSRQPGEADTAKDATSEPAADATTAPGGTAAETARERELRERRRSWGHLPLRDRDEVIEGMDEAVLPRFREWVERYYRALQGAPEDEDR